MADSGSLTIGKVVKKLAPRYPDLSVSKVRYLEDEGLLEPDRTPGGYRLYSPADVARLETILYLQKEEFLPLSVIRDRLENGSGSQDGEAGDSAQAGEGQPGSEERSVGQVLAELSMRDTKEIRDRLHPIERVTDLTEAPVGFVQQLAEIGMIQLKRSPHGRDLVEGYDLPLIRAAYRLRRYGIEPRNLRMYVQAANRESAMYEQALIIDAHKHGTDESQRYSDVNDAFDSIASYTNAIRMTLIKRRVSQTIRGIDAP